MSRHLMYVILIFCLLGAAGCAGQSAPQQIAAYPKVTAIAQYPGSLVVIYHTYLELRVADVERSASRAVQLANSYGGYLSGSQSWFVDGRKVTTLELSVPTVQFDSLRRSLQGLGELVNESLSGELVERRYYDDTQLWSTVTLTLRPSGIAQPPIDTGGWNPLRTLSQAWSVSVAIFGFILNLLIWVVVVGGPFVLIGLAARWFIRRSKKSS
ncbi:MAG: DUF4349 domain-containing protein [Anaerolineales bacterium]|nr:DUF4349 domain-containing protein [Anaerolineales bacterium]